MRLYRQGVSANRALDFSSDFEMGLELFEETKPLIPLVQGAHAALEAAHTEAEALVKPRRAAKRQRDLQEYRAERAVDKLVSQCREADGNRASGFVSGVVIPEGVVAVKAPIGRAQVMMLDKVIERLKNASDPRVAVVAEQMVSELTEARNALGDAETTYQTARAAHRTALDLVELRQEEHRRAMDALFGQLRSLFPGDTRTQNLIAPDNDAIRRDNERDSDTE